MYSKAAIFSLLLIGVLGSSDAWCTRIKKNETFHHIFVCYNSQDIQSDILKPPANETLDAAFIFSPIPTIQSSTFARLPDLRTLLLLSCDVSDIEDDAFKATPKVKLLLLSANDLTTVKGVWFEPLKDLEELMLSDNKIETIDEHLVQVLSKMKHFNFLDLSNNRLKVLPANFGLLEDVERLSLWNNPYHFKQDMMIADWMGEGYVYHHVDELRQPIFNASVKCNQTLPADVSHQVFDQCVVKLWDEQLLGSTST